MANFEESYIVRVRADGDAFVEQVRPRRRLHVDDLADIGAVIARLVASGREATT